MDFTPAVGRSVVYAFRNPGAWLTTAAGLVPDPTRHPEVPLWIYRPAQIVRLWNREPGTANLVVFLDGTNDRGVLSSTHLTPDQTPLVWKTSVVHGEQRSADGSPSPQEHYLARVPEDHPLN